MGNQNYFVFITIMPITLMLITAQSIKTDLIPFHTSVMYEMHNDYRHGHGLPAVILDQSLSFKALGYLKIEGKEVEFENDEYGVNIFRRKNSTTSSTKGVSAETVFLSWYEEGEKYDYSKEPTDIENTKHFTQILWKETTKIGVVAIDFGEEIIVAVIYEPKGNIKGKFRDNLKPPQIKPKFNL